MLSSKKDFRLKNYEHRAVRRRKPVAPRILAGAFISPSAPIPAPPHTIRGQSAEHDATSNGLGVLLPVVENLLAAAHEGLLNPFAGARGGGEEGYSIPGFTNNVRFILMCAIAARCSK